MKSIIIVAHKFLQQPDDDLITYLNNKHYPSIVHITHSFPDAKDRKSKYVKYGNDRIEQSQETYDYSKFPDPVIYGKELFYTLKWVIAQKGRGDLYIGMDGMCAMFGLILKYLGKVDKVFFWAMDFVPENRFKTSFGRIKNWLYHRINIFAYLNCDEMWDISPRMSEAREKFLGISQSAYKSHRVVPFGVWVNRIKTYSYEECEKHTIVFMGHLLEKQGAQLVVEALPELSRIFPDIKFKIIGTGRYKDELVKLSNRLGVNDKCVFMGEIPDHAVLEDEIAKCAVAVAPYVKELDTWTYYADPGKIKVYLACGVPVVMTDLPWIFTEVENTGSGLIVRSGDSISSKIEQLLNATNNSLFRTNARKYSNNFNYIRIFSELTF